MFKQNKLSLKEAKRDLAIFLYCAGRYKAPLLPLDSRLKESAQSLHIMTLEVLHRGIYIKVCYWLLHLSTDVVVNAIAGATQS